VVSGNALRGGHADHGHEGRPERVVVEQSKRPIDVPIVQSGVRLLDQRPSRTKRVVPERGQV